MAASHPFAGGGISGRHTEKRDAENDEDYVEHEDSPTATMADRVLSRETS